MAYPYPEIKKWPLMSSGWLSFFICLIYVASIPFFRRIARNEHGVWTRIVQKYVMLSLAVINFLLSIFFILMGIKLRYNLICEPASLLHQRHRQYQQASVFSSQRWSWWWIWITGHDLENDTRLKEAEIRVSKGMWVYLITKLLEFTDQIMIAVRDKDVAPEEVAHHVIMVLITWKGLSSVPGGSTIIWVTMNTTFLAIAYTYQSSRRFLKDMGYPNENFWNRVKRAVIFVKVAHFVLAGFHALTIILSPYSHCDYPKKYAFVILVLSSLMTYINIPKVFPGAGGLPGIPGLGPGRGDDGSLRNAPDSQPGPPGNRNAPPPSDPNSPTGNLQKFQNVNATDADATDGPKTTLLQRRRLKIALITPKEVPPQQEDQSSDEQVLKRERRPFPW